MGLLPPHCSCLPTPKANTAGSVPVAEEPVPLTTSGLGQAAFLGTLPLGHLLASLSGHVGSPGAKQEQEKVSLHPL